MADSERDYLKAMNRAADDYLKGDIDAMEMSEDEREHAAHECAIEMAKAEQLMATLGTGIDEYERAQNKLAQLRIVGYRLGDAWDERWEGDTGEIINS